MFCWIVKLYYKLLMNLWWCKKQINSTTALNVWCNKFVMVFFSGFSPNLPTEVVIDFLLKFSSHHCHVMIEYIVGLSSGYWRIQRPFNPQINSTALSLSLSLSLSHVWCNIVMVVLSKFSKFANRICNGFLLGFFLEFPTHVTIP